MPSSKTTKKCQTCHSDLPATAFSRHRTSRDNRRHDCRLCVRTQRTAQNRDPKDDQVSQWWARQESTDDWLSAHNYRWRRIRPGRTAVEWITVLHDPDGRQTTESAALAQIELQEATALTRCTRRSQR